MTDMNDHASEEANQVERSEVKTPWYYASLFIRCPVCKSEPGEFCETKDGRYLKEKHHFVRYRAARNELRKLYKVGKCYQVISEGYKVPGSPIREGRKSRKEERIPA